MPDDAAARAEAERLHVRDQSARALGVRLVDAGLGRASVAMTVEADMCNGLGLCHGGVIFTLADCAFEYACNSHGRATVAAGAEVDFVRPAAAGAELTASCEERHRGRAGGIYDVVVTDGDDRIVALFRGRAREFPSR